ncbi:putative phage tail tape measure protein (plasmid) [Selenomonas ruminantium subsp. lactilytica TAM6421]|uniref:Putative phage tail tape measure protein n=1 Tax=Selenomonas ruminantium subsp. lactilytica (strain NBRC 103574 / TAM6421) TaxID=927704 RepID=I0GVA2_SELRL|nr:phage tail tape measure protein [Selenomonas ruminantium]BAL84689.1 putative phage tail tape measure protein [Selenomonas ruminantium subsp. lactilytica TAM6421]
MDKNQELRTNLVLEANSALTAIRELSDGLDKISKLKFDNVKSGFDSLTKAFQAAQKMSSKVAKTQVKEEEELQNLMQKRKKIIADMMNQFSKEKTGLSVKVDMSAAQKELQKTTRMVADMYDALGQTGKAKTLMGEALNVLAKLSNGGAKGIGLESAKREYKDFERQLQENKAMRAELDRQVANGIAEQHRQEAVKKGKDPYSDPVYANSEAGKKAKKIKDQQEAEAKAKAEQQKKDTEALQKYLEQKEKAYARELEAEAALARKRKENENQRIEATKKRQELNKDEWAAVQKALGEKERDPHRNDLYKTTGTYYPEMNRRERLSATPSEADELAKMRAEDINNRRLARESAEKKRQAQAEEKAELDRMKAQEINNNRLARERLEREQQLTNARLDNEKRVQAEIKQNEDRIKKNRADAQSGFTKYFNLQDKLGKFTRDINFLSGKEVSETKMHQLLEEMEKIRRKALDIGATDIASKLTKNMLSGVKVVTEAEKEAAREKKKADNEAQKRLKEQAKLIEDIAKLWKDIEKYRGADGQSLSKKGYDNMLGRISNLRDRAVEQGLHGDATLLNPSLLNGVNTKLGQFNNRLSEAKDKAQQLYMRFRETGKEADKLNFLKAKADLKEMNNLAEDFDRAISKARRHELTLGNIAKRARESANWQIGGRIENTVVDFPSEVISSVSKYELAMAGIAQVLPKVEEGQSAANAQFGKFADIAARYGQSLDSALESAKSIGRMYGQADGNHNKGAENTSLLTAQAMKMATVDNFDPIEATRGLESALSQFNLQTEDTNLLMERSGKILDVWTKLAHNSGASAQDLVQGVNQAGAAAHQCGVSFETLNSLVAVGIRSTGKTGNEIGTTLKSMFSSILSDKNIKSMEQFGVRVYDIGENGSRKLRDMKDIILDISRVLSTGGKDAKELRDFMMPIAGGKQQYSKIDAILANYKELQRTMGEASDSAGFTDKQLELQLNTISRKWETLKTNVSHWFANSGADGLANDLKWILDTLNRIVNAVMDADTHFYQWAKLGVQIVIAWKAIPALINMAARAAGRFAAASTFKGGASAGVASLGSGLATQFSAAKYGEMRKQLQAGNVQIAKANSLMTIWNGLMTKGARASSVAAFGVKLFSGAIGTLRGIVAALGGPMGLAITAAMLLSEQFIASANDAEVLKEKQEDIIQKSEEVATTTALELEKHDEAAKKAQELADQYNMLVDSLNALKAADDGSAESAQRQADVRKQMGAISDEVQQILHANAIEFDKDGKINKDTIESLAEADKAKTIEKIDNAQSEITAEKDRLDAKIESAKIILEAQKAEINSTYAVATAYKALYATVTALEGLMAGFDFGMQGALESTMIGGASRFVFGDAKTDEWIASFKSSAQSHAQNFANRLDFLSSGKNILALQNVIEQQKIIDSLQPQVDRLSDRWNSLEAVKRGVGYDQDKHEYYEKREDIDTSGRIPGGGKEHPLSEAEKKAAAKEAAKAKREAAKAAREQAKLERQKEIVSFRNDEPMDYVNTVSKETGALTIGQLLSFAAALNGHNDPWKVHADYFSDKNIFKVPEALTNQYADGKTDEESRFWAFSKWLQNNQARFGGYEGALEAYYKTIHPQTSDEELKRKAEAWMNEGEYFDSKHDYNKNKSVLTHHSAYGTGYASGDVITGSQYDDYINRMAERYGVDKVLAHQIAERESTHGQYSSNVMQVESATGREMGFSDMSDPFQSIEAGLKYFAKMLNDNNGNIEAALRAYNGGGDPNYVENVLKHKYTPVGVTGNSSIWDKAAEHLSDQGLLDYGAGAENLGLQCAAFVSKVLVEAGVKGLNSINVDELARQADAQGLYHSADSGYQPQKGDIYIWGHHTGFADGQGNYIARNSTEGVHFGNELDYRANFGGLRGYISTGSALGGSSKQAAFQWKNSESDGQPTLLNWRPNQQNVVQNWYERQQDLFKLQEQEVKMLEDAGQMAESIKEQSQTARDKANTQATYLAITKRNVLEAYKLFIKKMSEDSDVQAALKRNGTTITNISPSDMDDLIQRMKNAKKNTEELERLWKVVKEFKFDSNGNSTKLQEIDLNEKQQRIEAAKASGYMTPQEEEDYALNSLDLWYQQESSGKIFQDPRMEEEYHRQRATVYQTRLERLQVEAEKADEDAPAVKEELRQKVLAAKNNVDSKEAALHNASTPEEIAKAKKELDEAQNALDLQSETWRNVEQHGTDAQRKIAQETSKTIANLNKETKAADKVGTEIKQKIGNGIKTMFSDVLIEGNNFKDAWKNLWTDIGKFALDRLLEIQMSKWFTPIGKATGGSVKAGATGGMVTNLSGIARFANGGYTYTNGLIQGAGTGTSDSILTYLAHRGQFIATSNGEYIIKKSSVDKLGVGFLDTLNNNPEAIGALNGLKRYANGGNLGESYAPSMSLKGINGYKTFNKSNMEKQMSFSTRKMETLLQGLRQDVQDGNKSDGSVAQPIILNTQADSASVMKAIAKNPRALQAILGNNQRRGFR